MGGRDVAKGIDHRQHRQARNEGGGQDSRRAAFQSRGGGQSNRRENDPECPHELGRVSPHHPRATSSNSPETRARIWLRILRTSSMGLPLGSSSSQSSER